MQLIVLGSAAAEGWPALFCACQACAKARELGGKNIRRRTSYRLGERIQIDWGPDTFGAYLQYGLDSSRLRHLIVTHTHGDHFVPHELYYRREGFSQLPPGGILQIHGPPDVEYGLADAHENPALLQVEFAELEPYEDRPLDDGVVATPIPAAHGTDIAAYNYIFTVGDRKLLLGHDTGWWDETVWSYLAGVQFDAVIMDCTYGRREKATGHLGCPDVVRVKQRLAEQGSLRANCRFVANHFSHNGAWLHDELIDYFHPHNIEPAYDGMTIDL